MLKNSEVDESKVYLAGGSLRDHLVSKTAKDFDLYCEDEETFCKLNDFLDHIKTGYKKKSDTAVTYTLSFSEQEVQVIKSIGKAKELIKRFDFTLNTNYIYFSEKWDVGSKRFLKISKLIVLEKQQPVNSVFAQKFLFSRLIKFLEKGYQIDKENLQKIFERVIADLDEEKVYELSDLVGGS